MRVRLSKREVFRQLWVHELGQYVPDLSMRIESSYAEFRRLLEDQYQTEPIEPTEGCRECFDWLRSEGIAIGLTTGFYRQVTDVILSRLGWNQGLDERHVGTSKTLIQASVTSDEVPEGRPAPHMIRRTTTIQPTLVWHPCAKPSPNTRPDIPVFMSMLPK